MADEKEVKEKKKKGTGGKRGSGYDVAAAAKGETKVSPEKAPRLKVRYDKEVAASLKKEFNLKPGEIPRVSKIVINCGVKDAVGNPKAIDGTLNDLAVIAGQRPVVTRAKKAIANFKLRKGLPIGARVTLRKARMWEFLDRLINVALPRVRDFKGINSRSFDGRGNYSLGIREQIIFPEINYDKVDSIRGLTVTIQTTAKDNEQGRALLGQLGMPFKK